MILTFNEFLYEEANDHADIEIDDNELYNKNGQPLSNWQISFKKALKHWRISSPSELKTRIDWTRFIEDVRTTADTLDSVDSE